VDGKVGCHKALWISGEEGLLRTRAELTLLLRCVFAPMGLDQIPLLRLTRR